MDKIYTKMIWIMKGLPTPRYLSLTDSTDLAQVVAELGLPLIVKPPHEGSTIGITKVRAADELKAAYDIAAGFDDVVLAEEFVTGREFTVAVLGRGANARALPIVEIVAPGGNYDYQNKYFNDDTQYLCPPELDPATSAEMQRLAVEAFNAIDCEGWGRVDFLLRASDNKLFLIEVNTSPGMTGHSLVPMAARAIGMSYEDLCVEIVATARLKLAKGQG
jgi:D-alanine-D-alanine ligase